MEVTLLEENILGKRMRWGKNEGSNQRYVSKVFEYYWRKIHYCNCKKAAYIY